MNFSYIDSITHIGDVISKDIPTPVGMSFMCVTASARVDISNLNNNTSYPINDIACVYSYDGYTLRASLTRDSHPGNGKVLDYAIYFR